MEQEVSTDLAAKCKMVGDFDKIKTEEMDDESDLIEVEGKTHVELGNYSSSYKTYSYIDSIDR